MTFFQDPRSEAFGWTLVHALWQLALLAALAAGLLASMRRAAANSRYLASLFVLLLMAAAPVITFVTLLPRTAAPLPAPQTLHITPAPAPAGAITAPLAAAP